MTPRERQLIYSIHYSLAKGQIPQFFMYLFKHSYWLFFNRLLKIRQEISIIVIDEKINAFDETPTNCLILLIKTK